MHVKRCLGKLPKNFHSKLACVPMQLLRMYLFLCFLLDHVVGSTFKWPDLKVMTTGVLCRQWYQLQFAGELVVLR